MAAEEYVAQTAQGHAALLLGRGLALGELHRLLHAYLLLAVAHRGMIWRGHGTGLGLVYREALALRTRRLLSTRNTLRALRARRLLCALRLLSAPGTLGLLCAIRFLSTLGALGLPGAIGDLGLHRLLLFVGTRHGEDYDGAVVGAAGREGCVDQVAGAAAAGEDCRNLVIGNHVAQAVGAYDVDIAVDDRHLGREAGDIDKGTRHPHGVVYQIGGG